MDREQILQLVEIYFKKGDIRDDGSYDVVVKFAEKIYYERPE